MDLGARLPTAHCVGRDGRARRPRLEDGRRKEVRTCRTITTEAMRDGAIGFSTSRT